MKFVLASGSPRRLELLKSAGLTFSVEVPNIEEKPSSGESAIDYVRRNALEKAQVVTKNWSHSKHEKIIVLSADTIVLLDGNIMEKPLDETEAIQMLGNLSGRSHKVVTGYAIAINSEEREQVEVFHEETSVTFKSLSFAEIKSYVATGEPMDKAGSYAAQGVGAYMIAAINGSYTNVIGLPVAQVFENLDRILKQEGNEGIAALPWQYRD